MTTTSLNLDTWLVKNVYVKANQGEVNSRFLEITLTDKSTPLDISGKTVVFYATKPDGNVIYNLCTIENAEDGVISVCLTSQMSAVAGKMPCEIHIIANNRATLKVVGLELEIVKCADLEDAVESTSEFTALERAMAEYDEASDAIDAHIANKNNPHEVTTAQIGAANAVHTHSFSSLENRPTTLSGYGITDAVPSSRTVNSKALTANITLDCSDVGAASSTDVGSVANLNTTAKTVVGAINELYSAINGLVDGDEVNY